MVSQVLVARSHLPLDPPVVVNVVVVGRIPATENLRTEICNDDDDDHEDLAAIIGGGRNGDSARHRAIAKALTLWALHGKNQAKIRRCHPPPPLGRRRI